MARGIDIADVAWVVQFDPPSNAEAFVHRCGRTARDVSSDKVLAHETQLSNSVEKIRTTSDFVQFMAFS